MIPHHLKVLPSAAAAMRRHEAAWKECPKCIISEWRQNVVFARGEVPCQVLFIGEGPGRDEDREGYPFVGSSGTILQPMIEEALADFWERTPCRICGTKRVDHLVKEHSFFPRNRSRFSYAITNIVSCRPTDNVGGKNRAPNQDEIINCRPRLTEFLVRVAKPKVIVLLGRVAKNNGPEWDGVPILHMHHPAYLLRAGGKNSNMCKEECNKLINFIRKEVPHGIV